MNNNLKWKHFVEYLNNKPEATKIEITAYIYELKTGNKWDLPLETEQFSRDVYERALNISCSTIEDKGNETLDVNRVMRILIKAARELGECD